MKGYKFDLDIADEDENGDGITIHCKGEISAYILATMYARNGDPGDPAEGGEIEFSEKPTVTMADGTAEAFDGDWNWLEEQILEQTDCEHEQDRQGDYDNYDYDYQGQEFDND